jgi:mercuric ion binding protein
MNSFLRTTVLTMALAFSLISTTQTVSAAESKIVTLDVPGMTCKFCPITVRKALNKVPGVIEASSDYDTKTATVKFDPEKTNVEALTSATANAGYPSSLKK